MGDNPVRLGILGAGMIATVGYGVLPNLHHLGDGVEVVAIADPALDRAQQAAKEFGISQVYNSLEDMLRDADVEAVANLTPISYHGSTSLKIVEAGKHLITEKPFASTMEEADAIIEAAQRHGVVVICAPPDSLYPAHMEARRLVDAGAIGKIAFARIHASHGGPGSAMWPGWPTDPSWFYQEGSGPLLDMGVYGIHQANNLMGPAKRVVAFSGVSEPTRTLRSGPHAGLVIDVTADDNTLLMLDFGDARYAVIDGTFTVNATTAPRVELYGRKGTINIYNPWVPQPLKVFKHEILPGVDGWVADGSWDYLEMDKIHKLGRAILVKHLVDVLRGGAENVLTAERGRHELEIMLKVVESARTGRTLDLTTTY
jgi:predicted dehydrogenase